jgi:hypothetical protein
MMAAPFFLFLMREVRMDYSLKTVLQAFADGSPLVLLVLALVTWLGSAGLKGRVQFFAGALIGFVIGVAYLIAELGLPGAFAGWFYLVLYGIVLGLAPSGIYETGKKLVGNYPVKPK